MKKNSLYIETYGCQMNEYDSDRIINALNANTTTKPEEADLIIINTCAIREKADQKALSSLGRYKHLKSKKPDLIIGISGCVAQLYGDKLLNKMPYLDFVLGPRAISKLPEIITDIKAKRSRPVETSFDIEELFDVTPYHEEGKITAFVSVQQGCNKKCAYCIVPTVRGCEVNRPLEDIIRESVYLLSKGVKEITLIGQTVNSWKFDGYKFADLLRALGELDTLERIRFTTSYPRDITKKMIEAMRDVEKVCHHLHLPVQSGSNKVLKLMNRTYTREWYLESIAKLKDAVPDIALSSDIIIGFPGETNEDFDETMTLMEEAEFESSFSFKYSPRPGTRGEELYRSYKIEDSVASERLSILQKYQKELTFAKNMQRVGKSEQVLVEDQSKNNLDFLMGRTTHNRIVNFKGKKSLIGSLVDVRINEGLSNSLRGDVLNQTREVA
ncbi:MAG: tRNA (N6-isopentenyl adenosine(37)-C2)-methylthiotransferase MiaB [Thermodesulfobacteriota bacterium]